MRIRNKFLLHVTILLLTLAVAIIGTTVLLNKQSQEAVLQAINLKFRNLQSLSAQQFELSRRVAEKGVAEASGVKTIDRIREITNKSNQSLQEAIGQEVQQTNASVTESLSNQTKLAVEAMEELRLQSVKLINRIIEQDQKTLRRLSHASINNIESMITASLDSRQRFAQEREVLEEYVSSQLEATNQEIDAIVASLLLAADTAAAQPYDLQLLVVEQLESLKAKIGNQLQLLINNQLDSVDLQMQVTTEEIRLTAHKIQWAIDRELEMNGKVQEMDSYKTLVQLHIAHGQVQEGFKDSADQVVHSLDELAHILPEQIKNASGMTSWLLNSKFLEARSSAETARDMVGERLTQDNQQAQKVFDDAINETQQVISTAYLDAQKRTLLWALAITAGVVVLGLLLSLVMTKNLLTPINRVLNFANNLAAGKRDERLPEGSDEMGGMSHALNKMNDELLRLEQATIDSFIQTLDQVLDCIFLLDPKTFRFTYVNQGAVDHLGYSREQLLNMTPIDISGELSEQQIQEILLPLCDTPGTSRLVTTVHCNSQGEHIPVEVLVRYVVPPGNDPRFVAIVRDVSEKVRERKEKEEMQAELLHKQKLESVGQLAAGIAHEINTPTQFVGTNIDFLADTFKDLQDFFTALNDQSQTWPPEARKQLEKNLGELDWEYLAEEIPLAIEQSRDGIKRVSTLVLAMKQFSHPGTRELTPANLHEVIDTALTVTRNEWKYVAEVKTDFSLNLPLIPLLVDEIGQVLLNLIVNAVHALEEQQAIVGSKEKGTITITTKRLAEMVELRFADSGKGIPQKIIKKIFDPFFTTKEVGKGTGQGLAISRDVIVKKHHGSIQVESKEGEGTTFVICLPLSKDL